MEDSNLTDPEIFLQEGLATDVFLCETHYFVYRTLGENYQLINQVSDDNFLKHVSYLQGSARDMMLLYLARIHDKKSKKYKVRCLEELLDECGKVSSVNFPILEEELEFRPSITNLIEITGLKPDSHCLVSQENFLLFLRSVLNSDRVKRSIKNLSFVRGKYIAHNEHNVIPGDMNSFWDDCFYLLSISKLFLSIVGNLFFNSNYRLEETIEPNTVDFGVSQDSYWLIEFLEKYIDKDKIMRWWR
jgi:hypothetical protein